MPRQKLKNGLAKMINVGMYTIFIVGKEKKSTMVPTLNKIQ